MAALVILSISALAGYSSASPLVWPLTALSLALTSWAENYLLARRAADLGLGDSVREALLRSSANGFIATGVSYWAGVLLRHLSGL